MGQVIPFPTSRIARKPRRRVDVFGGHFELLQRLVIWDRLTVAAVALVALCAAV